ncbi:hypothetical protein PYCC9005_001123 [Savitreella phatthalungensis]
MAANAQRNAADALVNLLGDLDEQLADMAIEVKRKEADMYAPLYTKRSKVTSLVPRFWCTVFAAAEELKPFIGPPELDLLKSCIDVRTEYLGGKSGDDWRLSMTFEPNAYLPEGSTLLQRDFCFSLEGELTSPPTEIGWVSERQNLCYLARREKRYSFFHLFGLTETSDETTDLEKAALFLKDDIYPDALSYFISVLLPQDTPADTTTTTAANTGYNSPVPESMTTSFLDQQAKADAHAASTSKAVKSSELGLGLGKHADLAARGKDGGLGLPTLEPGILDRYCTNASTPLAPELLQHRQESIDAYGEMMMITLNQAQWQSFMIRAHGVKRVLEIGCYTGFSALVAAFAGAEEVVTLELDPGLASFAKLAVHKICPPSSAIRVVQGDAHKTIRDAGVVDGKFDFIFIDAEKQGYADYLEAVLSRELLSSNGVIVCDNTLRRGFAAATSEQMPPRHPAPTEVQRQRHEDFVSTVEAVRSFNAAVQRDPQLDCVLLPIFDGVTLIRIRADKGRA